MGLVQVMEDNKKKVLTQMDGVGVQELTVPNNHSNW